MFGKLKVLALTGALAASSFGASGAQAAGWIVGLVDGKSIVIIDPATRKVTSLGCWSLRRRPMTACSIRWDRSA